jgi:hypothetical protein
VSAAAAPGGRANDARIAALIAAAGVLAVIALLPFLIAVIDQLEPEKRIPWPLLAAAQVGQGGVVLFFAAWGGLKLGRPLGLDAPVLRRRFDASIPTPPARVFLAVAVIGYALGLLLIQIDRPFAARMPPAKLPLPHPGTWMSALSCLYGGIAEETLCRLLVVSALARLLLALRCGRALALTLAIVLAAVAFGAGHLPLAHAVWGLTPLVVARIVLINALAGLAFGAAFARFGFEAAVLMHISADLALHVWPGLELTPGT